MKAIILIALACIASAAAVAPFQKATTYDGLKRQIMTAVYAKAGSRSDVIDLADPLNLNDTTIALTNNLLSGIVTLSGGVVTGGSTLVDDIAVNLLTLKLTVKIDLAGGRITGAYTITGEANLESGHHVVQGAGQLDASINNFQLTATGTLRVNIITNKASIVNLDTQRLSFDSVDLRAITGATVDGEPVDWEAVTADAKETFDKIYAEKKAEILKEIEAAINEILGEYTLAELIDLITGSRGLASLH